LEGFVVVTTPATVAATRESALGSIGPKTRKAGRPATTSFGPGVTEFHDALL
jgi:hypothetical protein